MNGIVARRGVARAAVAIAVAVALPAAAANAHIQVRPTLAAPGDPVLWTVLIPSEEEAGTRQVELAVPADVLPFSYEDQPGWARTVRPNPDGSVRSIVWRGRTPGDGLATFRFLASTPEREGELAWKAIQTYRDGDVVRWIGSPSSETPASVTTISRSAPRENAGGESGGGAPGASVPGRDDPPAASGDATADGAVDQVARGLGLIALLVAIGTLARRRTKGAVTTA